MLKFEKTRPWKALVWRTFKSLNPILIRSQTRSHSTRTLTRIWRVWKNMPRCRSKWSDSTRPKLSTSSSRCSSWISWIAHSSMSALQTLFLFPSFECIIVLFIMRIIFIGVCVCVLFYAFFVMWYLIKNFSQIKLKFNLNLYYRLWSVMFILIFTI